MLTKELTDLGLKPTEGTGGAVFQGECSDGMRVALHSRVAGGLVRRIGTVRGGSGATLVGAVRALDWRPWVHPAQTVDVRATGSMGRMHRGAVEGAVRKGIAESLRGPRRAGRRPPRSSASILVRAENDRLEISIDAVGELMHRRGWRKETAKAPLRENLACAVLTLVGWRPGEALVDPMCGSGTFPIEAGRATLGMATGSARHFAFEDWPSHDPREWATLKAKRAPAVRGAPIRGSDRDAGAIEAARANLGRSGAGSVVSFSVADVRDIEAPADSGALVCNPPWGVRIGGDHARGAWVAIGETARARFPGWRVALLAPSSDLARATGLPVQTAATFLSGGQRVSVWIGSVP